MRIIKNTGYYPLTDNMDIDVDSDGVNDFRFNNYIDFSLATGTVGLASFLSLQPNALYFGHFNTKDTTYIHTTKSALTYDTTNKVYYTYYNSTYYCKNEPSNDAINSIAPQVYLYNISDSTKIRMHNEWVSGTSYTFNYNYIEPGSPGGNQVGDTVAYTFYHYNLTCKDFPIGVVRYIAIKVNNKLGWIKLKFTGSYPRCMVNIIETAIQK